MVNGFSMNILLRIEGTFYAIAALLIYWQQGFSWWLFAGLILVPDLSMLGYLAGPRVGAICYNVVHSTVLPWAMLLYCYLRPSDLTLALTMIWFAHIGIDRALGYGLKYTTGFKDTHLGSVGQQK
jgi:hypothetical protein